MRRILVLATLSLLAGCSSAEPTCTERFADFAPATSREALLPYLEEVRAHFYQPIEVAPVTLVVRDLGDDTFFIANLDLETLEEPPLERSYEVVASSRIFEDPPPPIAVGAILVHEMKHIQDYTEKNTEQMAAFGLWYALGDVSEYERETDEAALGAGCHEGLKAYREWLYLRLSPADLEQKRKDYYTPEEIDMYRSAPTE